MRTEQLKKYDTAWLKKHLEAQTPFNFDRICKTLDREHEYSKELLETIVRTANMHDATKSITSGVALEILRQIYNRVNDLTFEQGLEIEAEFRKRGFEE